MAHPTVIHLLALLISCTKGDDFDLIELVDYICYGKAFNRSEFLNYTGYGEGFTLSEALNYTGYGEGFTLPEALNYTGYGEGFTLPEALNYTGYGEGFTLAEALNSSGSTCGEDETVSASNFTNIQEPCSCSPLCAHYKDCCINSKYFVAEEQLWDPATSTCTRPKNYLTHFHLKKTCRSDWDDDETRASCQADSGPPLTSHRTNISYANPHCAICNYDFDASNDHIWPVGFTCHDNDYNSHAWYNDGYVWNNDSYEWNNDSYVWNNDSYGWFYDRYEWNYDTYDAWVTSGDHNTTAVQLTFRNSSHSYSVNYSFPVDAFSFFYSHNGTLGWLSDLIALTRYESHSNGDFNESKPYYKHQGGNRTQFSGSDNNYTCTMDPFTFDEKIMRRCLYAISTCASDWADREVEGMCLAYTDYYCHGTDYFRNPHCALCNHVDLYETNVCKSVVKVFSVPGSDFTELLKTTTLPVTPTCDFLRLLKRGVYNITNEAEKPDHFLHYVTIVGICLSVSCILLHLATFIATPRLMNLPAMNLASLCVALLLLYCSFLAGLFLEPLCVERAILTHYSLLATFCWMLVISFDVWRTIRRSITTLQRSSGLQWKRFSVYSAFCWVVPVLVMVPALVIEFSGLDTHFRPGYGGRKCWFSNPASLLVFVVAPLCVVMVLNIVSFSWSACLIYSTKFQIENRSIPRKDFCLFLRLAVIMGLTWVTGLIAAVVDRPGVWFVFVLLNTLQGLFIFVAFSCNKKIYEELKRNKPRQNRPQQQQQQQQQLPQPLAPNIALSVLPGLAHIL